MEHRPGSTEESRQTQPYPRLSTKVAHEAAVGQVNSLTDGITWMVWREDSRQIFYM